MTKYQEFLNTAGIISEDLFNEIVNSLPEYDTNKVDFSNIYMLDSQDEIASEIIATILLNWSCVTCENVDFERRTFDLVDVESLKDLKEINVAFSKWAITNYDECKEECLCEETNKEKDVFIHNYDFSNVPLEDLKEFLKKYEN
jgi:hypothetical protein